jgi:hypothetical protein
VHGIVFVAIHHYLREVGDGGMQSLCFPNPSAYIAVGEYPDDDIVMMAGMIANRLPSKPPVSEVLKSLGEGVPPAIRRIAPNLIPKGTTFEELLRAIERRPSVQRAVLPDFEVVRSIDASITLIHRGNASLCRFDEGLLIGLAAVLGEAVATRHPSCRQRNDERCVFMPRVLGSGSTQNMAKRSPSFSVEAGSGTSISGVSLVPGTSSSMIPGSGSPHVLPTPVPSSGTTPLPPPFADGYRGIPTPVPIRETAPSTPSRDVPTPVPGTERRRR